MRPEEAPMPPTPGAGFCALGEERPEGLGSVGARSSECGPGRLRRGTVASRTARARVAPGRREMTPMTER